MTERRVLVEKLILTISFTILLALLAQIRIPLPFTPVPLTLQTLGILFIGYFLGAHYGLLSVLIYLTLGVLGLPLFSGLKGGLSAITGPTGGYLIGFAVAVYLTGKAKEWGLLGSWLKALIVGVSVHLVIYLFGVLWFYSGFMKFSPYSTLTELLIFTVYPFILVDLFKSVIFAIAVSLHYRIRS